jgi:hypothetical protein
MVTTMKSLNQGHLHPKLEVPRLTCPSRDGTQASAVGGIHSRKDPFKQLVDSYSEHLHMSTQPVENARDNSLHPAFCKNLFHMPDHGYVVRIVKTYNLKLFFSLVYIFSSHDFSNLICQCSSRGYSLVSTNTYYSYKVPIKCLLYKRLR